MDCVWRCRESDQLLRIKGTAIDYMLGHRQSAPRSCEAGGQMFGAICTSEVQVLEVTGPYPHDDRRRFRYRSDPAAAKTAIDEQAKAGRLYLGEWHTHAQEHPRPSMSDIQAMKTLCTRSQLNASSVLLVIVGLGGRYDALYVCSFGMRTRMDWHYELATLG